MARPQLQPCDSHTHGLRNSPIAAVLLTNGDVDHIAGLLTLREGHVFDLFASAAIAEILDANPVFEVLNRQRVTRSIIVLDTPFQLLPGLTAELFAVPGKVPLFMEASDSVQTDLLGEQTVGVVLRAGDAAIHYIPGCARVTPALADRLRGAATVLFDGTLYRDDEMIHTGVGQKTGQRMGHMSMGSSEGSLAAFADLAVARKVYVHINNTNPVWWADSAERRAVDAAGWEVGYDGMEIVA